MTVEGPFALGPLTEVTCVQGESFVVSEANGDILPGGDDGLYVRDVRVLDHLVLTVDGHPPGALHGFNLDPAAAAFIGFLAASAADDVDPVALVDRRRAVHGSLHEEVRFTNYGRVPLTLAVRFSVGTDAAYIFDVRHRRTLTPLTGRPVDGTLRFEGEGDLTVVVTTDPPARTVDAGGLTVDCEVPVGASARVCLDVTATDVYGTATPQRRCASLARPAGTVAAPTRPLPVTLTDRRFQQLLDRGWADLGALRQGDPEEPRDQFCLAGSPWYLTLFGRDALWAATMALPFDVELAGGTLRTLARRQGVRHDLETEEAPGRILHEIRRGALTHRGDLPPNYYGTVDATPLFVVLVHEAWRWGLPEDEVLALIPHVEAAMRWLRDEGDPDGSGFVRYERVGERGLDNQGWKDSHDGVQFADGTIARPPIALCEVQGYAYDAARRAAELLDRFGFAGGDDWREYAARLARRFREAFWIDDREGRYPAIALDGAHRPVDGPASNMGHLLATGILSPDEAALVADQLTSPGMADGWGLRTMSSSHVGFNPLGYHTGSVWPHDTAIAVWGATLAGQHAAARTLLAGLVGVAATFEHRLPELFAGFARAHVAQPVPYPVACRPQAWAAGAPLLLLRAVLGLQPDVPNGRLVVAPMWPPPVRAAEVAGLPLAGRSVSIRVDAERGVEVEVEGPPLEVRVVDPLHSAGAAAVDD